MGRRLALGALAFLLLALTLLGGLLPGRTADAGTPPVAADEGPVAVTTSAPGQGVAERRAARPTAFPVDPTGPEPDLPDAPMTGSQVLLLGAPGLMWSDVSREATPQLWGLLERGAGAAVTVRAVRTRACEADGWLTLSAGQRAADLPQPDGCRALPEEGDPFGPVPRWADYLAAAAADPYAARPGLLSAALAEAEQCVVGARPGGTIVGADESGSNRFLLDRILPYFSDDTCVLTVVGRGSMPADAPGRQVILAGIEEHLESMSGAEDVNLVVLGVGDGDSPMAPRVMIAAGPDFGPGLLTSSSTRQDGLVQLTDVTATLLELAGAEADVAGRPIRVVSSAASATDRAEDLLGLSTRATTMRALAPVLTGVLAAGLALWAILWWRWRSRPWVAALGLTVAALPVATVAANVLPWWRIGSPGVAAIAVIGLITAGLAAAAVTAGRRWPAEPLAAGAVVWAATAAVLGLDVLTGSHLQTAAPFAYNPIVGGRFYGFGNSTFAPYGVAVLGVAAVVHGTGVVTARRIAAAGVLLLALGIEAAPAFGADFGGPPALLAAGVVLLAGLGRIRLGWRRIALLAGVGAVAAGLVLYADWLRPADQRTHLGNFLQQILDGDAGGVVGRKISQNLANLGEPRLIAMTVAGLLALWLLRGRCAHHAVRWLALSGLVLMGVGFAINDSGLAIPAFAAAVLVPALAAHTESRAAASPEIPDGAPDPVAVGGGPGDRQRGEGA